MKKVLFVMLAFAGTFLANDTSAQGKVGVFDLNVMVQAMPEYRRVDSLLQMYEQDSLRADYEFAVREYNRLDSTYKSDSAAKKPGSVLNYIKDQRTQFASTIVYWQQISQQKGDAKRQQLSAPIFDRIIPAYQKVLRENNYLVVLKPEAIEFFGSNKIDNVFERVAKELKITLPQELRSSQPTEQTGAAQQQPAARPPATNKAAPATKKP